MKEKRAKGFEDYRLIMRDRKALDRVLLKNINHQQNNAPKYMYETELIVSILSATKEM